MPEREILVSVPLALGMTDSGRIVLEYEDTPANREMARRVAVAMMADLNAARDAAMREAGR